MGTYLKADSAGGAEGHTEEPQVARDPKGSLEKSDEILFTL